MVRDTPARVIGPPEVVPPGSTLIIQRLTLVLAVVCALVVLVGLLLGWRRRRRHPHADPGPRRLGWPSRVAFGLGLVCALTTAWLWPPPFWVPRNPPLPRLMAADSVMYRTAADLPVSTRSQEWIDGLGGLKLGAGFRSTVEQGTTLGMPFNMVQPDTPDVDVRLGAYRSSSYPGPYPMTDPAYIQTMPGYSYDMHYAAVDLNRREVWELFNVSRVFGQWRATAGAHWSMDSAEYPVGSVIAAGLPLMPGVLTYDEVAAGKVTHVTHAAVTVSRGWIWPARHGDGTSTAVDAPPQGAWMRLRADVDLSGLGPEARVIAEGLKTYGLMLIDTTGGGFGIAGTTDSRWDDADLATLTKLSSDDFEVVDPTGIRISEDSMAVRPPG